MLEFVKKIVPFPYQVWWLEALFLVIICCLTHLPGLIFILSRTQKRELSKSNPSAMIPSSTFPTCPLEVKCTQSFQVLAQSLKLNSFSLTYPKEKKKKRGFLLFDTLKSYHRIYVLSLALMTDVKHINFFFCVVLNFFSC